MRNKQIFPSIEQRKAWASRKRNQRKPSFDKIIPVEKIRIGNSGRALLTKRPLSSKEMRRLTSSLFVYKKKNGLCIITDRPLSVIYYPGCAIKRSYETHNFCI